MAWEALEAFVRESNAIEGIRRDPTSDEIEAHEIFLALNAVSLAALCRFQAVLAPNKPLRTQHGMNVHVGNHIPPDGGIGIRDAIVALLDEVLISNDPWRCHCRYETLHPFMDGNGRTGRALWAWHMQRLGRDPFALPFLHRFYYQTLEHSER